MYKYLLIAAFVACATASAVLHSDVHNVQRVHDDVAEVHSDVRADGFQYKMSTGDHVLSEAAGDEHGNIHGNFEWVSPEGVHVKLSYVADENGYQPSSDLLPTPPPIPAAILKSLEYLKTHAAKEEVVYHH